MDGLDWWLIHRDRLWIIIVNIANLASLSIVSSSMVMAGVIFSSFKFQECSLSCKIAASKYMRKHEWMWHYFVKYGFQRMLMTSLKISIQIKGFVILLKIRRVIGPFYAFWKHNLSGHWHYYLFRVILDLRRIYLSFRQGKLSIYI